jgi:hypothetical protein
MLPLKSILVNFITGGTVVASVSVLATYMSPVLGAIWWSFPFTILPSIYFMRNHGRSNQDVGIFLKSTTFAFILVLIAVYSMSHYFKNLSAFDNNWWSAVGKGTAIWLISAIIFYMIYKLCFE